MPSPFLGTPVVSEFRGWFTNLFNWKAQTLSLNSRENCLSTRDESAKILSKFGVICGLEDIEGWGILRCKLEEVLGTPHALGSRSGSDRVADSAGNTLLRPVRFRIEFTPAVGGNASRYVSVATLVLEKGALSSFKAAFQHLRTHWTCVSTRVTLTLYSRRGRLDIIPPRTSGENWVAVEAEAACA